MSAVRHRRDAETNFPHTSSCSRIRNAPMLELACAVPYRNAFIDILHKGSSSRCSDCIVYNTHLISLAESGLVI